ncbi:MAG TPA: SIMPL domain-containing protein [Phenylobacterium sp.]|nr:SIMPL domain-containing protein [Phenylobacterium sp.]
MRPVANLAAALAIAAAAQLAMAAPALAQTGEAAFRTTTLSLSAQGETRLKPDIVTLSLGVTSEAATAQAASAEASQKINAVVQALRSAGVAQRDIQTQWVQLTPRYSERSGSPRQIVAQQASSTLTVTVRDIGRAGAVLDLSVAAGANLVQGVRFGLADPAAPQRQARDQALRALQTEAVEVATVMGQRVVRLVSVNTQAYSDVVVTASRMAAPMAAGASIEPGELTVRADANGVFELAPR